jgi:FKBP-type peptidyl-prolyl cis-trans isomerase FklB
MPMPIPEPGVCEKEKNLLERPLSIAQNQAAADCSFPTNNKDFQMLQLPFPRFSTLAFALLLASTSLQAAGAMDKDTMSQADKFSYLQGYTLANRLKSAGLEVNADTFTQAIHDALNGKPSLFSEEEIEAIIAEQKKIEAARQEEENADATANLEKGKAFLAENAKKEGVTTLPSGVQYRVIESGDASGTSPKASDTVEVHYEGRRIDGKVFDSSYKRGKPASFPVSGVVKGFSEALQNMKPGDKWEVFIPSDLGYGERARGSDIRPNETLIFTLELIGIK